MQNSKKLVAQAMQTLYERNSWFAVDLYDKSLPQLI